MTRPESCQDYHKVLTSISDSTRQDLAMLARHESCQVSNWILDYNHEFIFKICGMNLAS